MVFFTVELYRDVNILDVRNIHHVLILCHVSCVFRCIFRWLATKNLKEMNFDHIEKGSPEDILMGLKTGKTTYAMVFETMCK